MKSIVQLNTEGVSQAVSIYAFQFGTVPAGIDSYQLTNDKVPARSSAQEIFWLERDISIPAKQYVRFNLRFSLNVHNSADLQICLTHHEAGTSMLWRWAAPIGYTGKWSKQEQQAPWYDDKMDYCINIAPSSMGIKVSLSEHAGPPSDQCAFIPLEDKNFVKMQRCD